MADLTTPALPAIKSTGDDRTAAEDNQIRAALLALYNALGAVDDGAVEDLAQRLAAADTRLDTADTRLDTADTRLDTADTRLDTADTRLDTADTRLDTADTRLDAADTRLDAADTRLDAADTRLDPLPDPDAARSLITLIAGDAQDAPLSWFGGTLWRMFTFRTGPTPPPTYDNEGRWVVTVGAPRLVSGAADNGGVDAYLFQTDGSEFTEETRDQSFYLSDYSGGVGLPWGSPPDPPIDVILEPDTDYTLSVGLWTDTDVGTVIDVSHLLAPLAPVSDLPDPGVAPAGALVVDAEGALGSQRAWPGGSIQRGPFSLARGFRAVASGPQSAALGSYTLASGSHAQAFGQYTNASGAGATALGAVTEARADGSLAAGHGTVTGETAYYSSAWGRGSATWKAMSRALGGGPIASPADAQATEYVLSTSTNGPAPATMPTEDGDMPLGTAAQYEVSLTACRFTSSVLLTAADIKTWAFRGTIAMLATGPTLVGLPDVPFERGDPTWTAVVSAAPSGPLITIQGDGGLVKWCAHVRLTEVRAV